MTPREEAVEAGSWAETLAHGRLGAEVAEAVVVAIEEAGLRVTCEQADSARRACLLARQTLELFHAHGPLGSLSWRAEIGSQDLTDAMNRLAAIEREVQS